MDQIRDEQDAGESDSGESGFRRTERSIISRGV